MAPPTLKLVRLTVIENATQKNVVGQKNWAAVRKPSAHVTVEATTAPKNTAEEWKQIKWSGDAGMVVDGRQNRRKLSLHASKKFHIQAELGGVSDYLDLWVLWATIEVMTKGMRPPGAAPFDRGSRDGTDKLGEVTYESLTSSVIDEAAGIFVNNVGASGKVAPTATLSPNGVSKVAKAGWEFKREVMSRIWMDGRPVADRKTGTKTWVNDTSSPTYQKLIPDELDRIYDLDAPDLRWGNKSTETYNNFRQWIEWNNQKCSDNASWSWQAQWKLDKNPSKQIILNKLDTVQIKLPDKPQIR